MTIKSEKKNLDNITNLYQTDDLVLELKHLYTCIKVCTKQVIREPFLT